MTTRRTETNHQSAERSVAGRIAGRKGPTRPLILVIEDNEHDWEIYGKLLWYNGFDVLLARDGEQGLARVRERQPDLVLLDLVLPKMSGIEVSRRMRADPKTKRTPIVVLSAQRAMAHRREAEALDCIRYLEKPISPLAVLHVAEEVLGRPPLPGDRPDSAPPPDELDVERRRRSARRVPTARSREFRSEDERMWAARQRPGPEPIEGSSAPSGDPPEPTSERIDEPADGAIDPGGDSVEQPPGRK